VAGNIFVMGRFEALAATGLADAVENFANYSSTSKTMSAFFSELIKRKQYRLISDLELYLQQVIVAESKKSQNIEEKKMLQRAYETLLNFINELKDQQEKGLPLAG